jgi:hypothetical protein
VTLMTTRVARTIWSTITRTKTPVKGPSASIGTGLKLYQDTCDAVPCLRAPEKEAQFRPENLETQEVLTGSPGHA